MKRFSKFFVATVASTVMLGTTAIAGSVSFNQTLSQSSYSTVGTTSGGATVAKATASLNQASYQVYFYAQGRSNMSNVGTITYPASSGTASYNSISYANYTGKFKLGPTSRYSSYSVSGTFTP